MRYPYRYVGCFFDAAQLWQALADCRTAPLEKAIDAPHVTFVYQPRTVDTALFGTPVRVMAVGYGNDGVNEGVQVWLCADAPALQAMIEAIPVPHITLSVGRDGQPVNTRDLAFAPITPVCLAGVYGGYTADHRVVLRPGE